MRQTNFEKSLKKGQIGERIIWKFLEDRGWIIYKPYTENKPHYFDIIATKNKEKVIAIDVKTKARFNNWAAQGINVNHYEQYLQFVERTNVPFYLVFIDDKIGDVHVADITKLKNGFNPTNNVIAWSLDQMHFLFKIDQETISKLSKYDQRNCKFKRWDL